MALHDATEKFQRWFIDHALPLWAERAYDQNRGGFYEALNLDATPAINRPRRVRVQARQIHTFSQAGIRGWHGDAEELAARGFEHFLDKACPQDGARGCVHLIDDDGAVIDDKRDLYDQAFLLLACASRWQAAKDDRALALADKTIAFLDRELASPHGGWHESDKRELPRRQNPHMHLFEAFMALYRVTETERYLNYAAHILNDCFPAFYDHTNRVIVESFQEDFSFDPQQIIIEPGHMFEWVWLLSNWEKITNGDFLSTRSRLYERGEYFGGNSQFYGFVCNRIDINDGEKRSSMRLWPQTEYLRASCAQGAFTRAESLIDDMFCSYLNTDVPGLWIDEFDINGAGVARDVPASILYHLHEAVVETESNKQTGTNE